MTTLNPTPEQIRLAMVRHGVPLHLYAGWDTLDGPNGDGRGRPWAGPDGSAGLQGVVVHHTATASALGPTGIPTLQWCARHYNKPAANWCIGRDGAAWLLAAGSCWHCGEGGPWPAIGAGVGMHGHFRLAGIEIDDPGHSNTITPAQIDSVGRILAAYKELCGWGPERIITHGDWTDAGQWLTDPQGHASPVGPNVGRKTDTLRKWYSATFWRQAAAQHAIAAGTPVPKPLPAVSLSAVQNAARKDPGAPQGHGVAAQSAVLVEKALLKVGLLESRFVDGAWGSKTIDAYASWQRRTVPGPYDGIPGITSLTKLANVTHIFRVVK